MWMALITPMLITMGASALALAFLIIFAETGLFVGFFLPGDSLLITFGMLTAAHLMPVPLAVVIAVLVMAAVLGDSVGYLIGARLGPALFSRPRSRVFNPDHLARAETFVARYGTAAVVLARFLPWARTFVPVMAGIGAMPRRTFLRVNAIGASTWVVGLTLAGYVMGQWPWVADHVQLATFLLGVCTLVPVLLVRALRRHRNPAPAATPHAALPAPSISPA